MLSFEKCTPEEKKILEDKLNVTMSRVNRAKEELDHLWLEYFEDANKSIAYETGYHHLQSAIDNISDLLSTSLFEFTVMSGYVFDGWDENIEKIHEGIKFCLADLGKSV